MQRRVLVRILEGACYWSKGGTKHERFTNGHNTVFVKRHREIPDQIAKQILKEAGLKWPR